MRAERRLGVMLEGTPKNEGGRPITGAALEPVIDEPPTLKKLF